MTTLLLVGCGKMGSALLAGWQFEFPDTNFHIIEPGPLNIEGVVVHKSLDAFPANLNPDIVVFAIKPQQLAEILPAYRTRFAAAPLYISIAAGKTLAFFAEHLGTGARIIRAMPNTPALVDAGMTVLAAPSSLPRTDRDTAQELMQSVGLVAWANESQMDAVTAVSGSGPAYVFLFLDALTKAAINAGLSAAMAKTLSLQTVTGACALASESNDNFEQLRKNVTSPGGTTAAALDILMHENALETLVENAVQAAKKRSQELSN